MQLLGYWTWRELWGPSYNHSHPRKCSFFGGCHLTLREMCGSLVNFFSVSSIKTILAASGHQCLTASAYTTRPCWNEDVGHLMPTLACGTRCWIICKVLFKSRAVVCVTLSLETPCCNRGDMNDQSKKQELMKSHSGFNLFFSLGTPALSTACMMLGTLKQQFLVCFSRNHLYWTI